MPEHTTSPSPVAEIPLPGVTAAPDIALPTTAAPAPPPQSVQAPAPAAPLMNLPQPSENLREVDFDDETVGGDKYELYKGRKDVTDRIYILTPKLALARVHFSKPTGYVICQSEWRLQGKAEHIVTMAECCKRMDPARKRIAALVLHYLTDSKGNLYKPLQFSLKMWRFSDKAFDKLREVNTEHKLTDVDIRIACEDDQFQKLTIVPCKESIYRDPAFQNSQYGQQVREWVHSLTHSPTGQPHDSTLWKAVGKKLTPQQLAEKLGVQGPAPVQASDTPIASVADLLT